MPTPTAIIVASRSWTGPTCPPRTRTRKPGRAETPTDCRTRKALTMPAMDRDSTTAVFALVLVTVVAIPARAQTASFTRTGDMATARSQHTATLLPNGHVLIAGGVQSTSLGVARVLANTELYDPRSEEHTSE